MIDLISENNLETYLILLIVVLLGINNVTEPTNDDY